VVPESLADKAGLAGGMTITGVNGRKFSSQRLKDGIADSPTQGKVELLVPRWRSLQTDRACRTPKVRSISN
jgi:S1-C subfamily serine protease